jgi:EAL domain-containing protein (putative c-di-GMP-specific phosphodiesterase class I)
VFLRLQEEEDSLLPPGGFLGYAEQFGMMAQIDRWVVRAVMAHCSQDEQRPDARSDIYWVNLSRAALRSAEFARSVQSQIRTEAFDGRRLCFEIGERDAAAAPAETLRLMDTLRPLHCRFALDGFGIERTLRPQADGTSFDFVKIDGRIVLGLLRDAKQVARVRAIQALANEMSAATVAQWVEDPATLTALRSLGVDYAQGFGIERPRRLAAPD